MFEQSDDIFWTVQYVFDPDAIGHDFAYTIGLAARGLPELYIDSAPRQAQSDDPWKLSSRDCCYQLNRFARMLIDGEIVPLQPITEQYDGGTTTVLWTPGEPTDPMAVGAYGPTDAKSIIVIAAEIVPAVIEPLSDLCAADEATWRSELARLLLDGVPNRRGLKGFRLPSPDASFTCTQTYGPLTPLVEARAYEVSQLTPPMIADVILRSLDCEFTIPVAATLGAAYAHARTVSRTPAAWNAEELAVTLVKSIRGPEGKSSAWRSVMKLTGFGAAEDTGDIRRGLSGTLVHAVAAHLVSTVVADRLDHSARLQAFGIWSSIKDSRSMAPEDPWWARSDILNAIRNEVAQLDDPRTNELLAAWLRMRSEERLVPILRGLAVTGARACPPASDLLGSTLIGLLALFVPDIEWPVTEFLCCATALLTEREKFSDDDVHAFCRRLTGALPGLEALMNSPVAERAA